MRVVFTVILFILLVPALIFLMGVFWWFGLNILSYAFDAPQLEIGYWKSLLVGIVANVLLSGAGALHRRD